MPGKPRTAALVAHLREEVEGSARVEYVLELIASGQTQEDVASALTVIYEGQPWKPNRRTLSAALHGHWPEELADAKRAAGEMYAEDALKAVKEAPETKEGIAKARELASMYRWLASKRDPANFGDTPSVALMVNNPGQMFLQAVARPGAVPPPKQKALPPKTEADDDA